MTTTATETKKLLAFPIQENQIDIWEASLKETFQDYYLGLSEEDKADILTGEHCEAWDGIKWDGRSNFLETTNHNHLKTEVCEDIIDNITDELAYDVCSHIGLKS